MPQTTTERQLVVPFVATCVALTLSVLAPLLICAATPSPVVGAWVGALWITVASGLPLAWIIGSGARRLYEFSFWLFVYAFFGLAPLVQLRSGSSPPTTPGMDWRNADTAVTIVAVSAAAFTVGAWIRSNLRGTTSTRVAATQKVNPRRVYFLSALALVINAYFISKIGLGSIFGSRDNLDIATAAIWPDPTTRAIVRASAAMLLLVAFIAVMQLRRQAAREKLRSKPTPTAVVIGFVLILSQNPISSPRYLAGTVLLSIAASLGMYATRRRFRTATCLIIIGLVFALPVADTFRHTTNTAIRTANPVAELASGDFDSFDQVANAELYVERYGSTNGRQALGVAFFWIPRSTWHTKPVDTGILLAESNGYTFTNLSSPLPAELFINGSWLLLIFGMSVFGWGARAADDRVMGGVEPWRTPTVLGCILPFYLILVLRGSLLQAMAYLLVIVLAARWVRQKPSRNRDNVTGDSVSADLAHA